MLLSVRSDLPNEKIGAAKKHRYRHSLVRLTTLSMKETGLRSQGLPFDFQAPLEQISLKKPLWPTLHWTLTSRPLLYVFSKLLMSKFESYKRLLRKLSRLQSAGQTAHKSPCSERRGTGGPEAPGRTFASHQGERLHPQAQDTDSAYCAHLISASMNWEGEAQRGAWNTNTER